MTHPRASPLPRWLGALPALGLAAACSFRATPEWARILAEVRERYPDVPQLAVSALEAREPPELPLLLDARTEAEYAVSHLQEALSTPNEAAALDALAGVDPAREVVVYCSVGMRSSDLAQRLRARGFTRAANLEGGIFAWANAGLPTYRGGERGEERFDAVHPFDQLWGSLLVPERRSK